MGGFCFGIQNKRERPGVKGFIIQMASFQTKLQQEFKSETQGQNPAPSMVEWMQAKLRRANPNAVYSRRLAQYFCSLEEAPSDKEYQSTLAWIGLGHLL